MKEVLLPHAKRFGFIPALKFYGCESEGAIFGNLLQYSVQLSQTFQYLVKDG